MLLADSSLASNSILHENKILKYRPDVTSQNDLDFKIISNHESMEFLSNSNQQYLDSLGYFELPSNPSEVVECDFCKKIGSRQNFKGRFCSKICVGRFAQR